MALESTALAALVVAASSFIVTNVDNAMVGTAQLAAAPTKRVPKVRNGQFAAAVILIAASLGLATALEEIPAWAIGLLGLLPLYVGIRGMVDLVRRRPAEERKAAMAAGFVSAMVLMISISGDNLAVYVAVFRAASTQHRIELLVLWVILSALMVWCSVLLARHARVQRLADRTAHLILPFLYVALAVLIFLSSGLI